MKRVDVIRHLERHGVKALVKTEVTVSSLLRKSAKI